MTLKKKSLEIFLAIVLRAIKMHESEITLIPGQGWKVDGRMGHYLRHWVEIEGTRYPQKWVYRHLFNLPEDFHFHQRYAKEFFENIGLPIGEL